MRQRLAILISLIVVIGILVLLNAASYVEVEHAPDSEQTPDRSTFNTGATGTRALYDFLHESGYQVARWRESSSSLLSFSGPKPATVVIVGRSLIPFSKSETEEILSWVKSGGRLVLIDRLPDRNLLPPSGEWRFSTYTPNYPGDELDPNDFERMTSGVKAAHASQPTALTRNVEAVLPSRFAGLIRIATTTKPPEPKLAATDAHAPPGEEETDESSPNPDASAEPSPSPHKYGPRIVLGDPSESTDLAGSPAPVVHFAQEGGALLVDYPHGKGRIVLLSDPYIVANNGISRADNLMLAINVVAGRGGLIAFDEYHQGRAVSHNALIQYFAGTPVLAICGQLALIGLAVVWSRGLRFARPLPLPQMDRRSSLEFVASMAELQQRARAHDLALENIYGRVRRVLVRYAGLSNASPRAEIAKRVALRSGLKQQKLETLMRNCEDTINGAPTTAKETLLLAKRLRQIESALGLRARSRDARQTSDKA